MALRLPALAPGALRNLLARPATRPYPLEVRTPFRGARARLEADLGACDLCGDCARRCPSAALEVRRGEQALAIRRLRCLACGACVEACPSGALRLEAEPSRVLDRAEAGPGAAAAEGLEVWPLPR